VGVLVEAKGRLIVGTGLAVAVAVGVSVAVAVDVGVSVGVCVGVSVGAITAMGAVACMVEVPPEDDTKLVVLISDPTAKPFTRMTKLQVLLAGNVMFETVIRLVSTTAVIVPTVQPADVEMAPVWAMRMLAGRLSVMLTLVRASAALGLTMLIVRSVVAARTMGEAANDLFTVGART
jgi:hypothetical protein